MIQRELEGSVTTKVLVATDGSEPSLRACRAAAVLLVAGRDEVRVLTVLSYTLYPYSVVPDMPLASEAEREEAAAAEVRRVTDQARQICQDAGLQMQVAHRYGNPADEILTETGEWHPDLLVLGRRGVRGIERWIGSVSEHVLHHAKVPVLLVP